jgi:two-component system, NtrC family, sensor histidine kinase HydH
MQYYRGLVFLIALLLTGIATYNKISVHGIALRSSEELLKASSSFVWITLAKTLRNPPFDRDHFTDAIKKHSGVQVAYLALYDFRGKIVLHSDSLLIGTMSNEPGIGGASRRLEEPQAGFDKLADGTILYVMDMEIDIREVDPNPFLLRVALHASSALADVQQAKRHIILSLSLIVFLWLMAWFFYRFSRRIEMLRYERLEREHLATLGEMAAVVAHEIRSPLSAIKGFSQYLAEKDSGNPAGDEGYRVIIHETIRLEQLTDDLLGYARVDKVHPVMFSWLELVDEVWSLIAQNRSDITVTKEISAQEDSVYSDREKLRRILMNVLQNSIDAVNNKGVIEIKVQNSRGKITLSIRDSGQGMDDKTIHHAFKPFFTTKVKGTGLGLAIVEKNVKSLDGTVSIASKLGIGTTVTIIIPWQKDGQKQI